MLAYQMIKKKIAQKYVPLRKKHSTFRLVPLMQLVRIQAQTICSEDTCEMEDNLLYKYIIRIPFVRCT